MTESELNSLNYRKGGNNYVLLANSINRWVAFNKSIVDNLSGKFGEYFNLIIYWHLDAGVNYYCIPYKAIKHLLTDDNLSNQKDGSIRWTFTIKHDLLCVRANSNISLNISSFINVPITSKSINDISYDSYYIEGRKKLILHYVKERDKNLIKSFKEHKERVDPALKCEICGMSFALKYGKLGVGYIEAHHIKPLSLLNKESVTTFNDLITVCSNCHRMLHKQNPPLTPEELKALIKS